jgi:uncharacterized repeat protein (TIGR02543 family)
MSGYAFDGWYTEGNGGGSRFTGSTPVTASIMVYAKWTVAPMPSGSLGQALAWLGIHAAEGGVYTIALNADEAIGPQTLSYSGKSVSLTLEGTVSERRVSLSSNGSLFTVESGVTLTLGADVTLEGRSGNSSSLVKVSSGGRLAMNTGSKITGNISSSGGTFTMDGGEISGNTSSSDGGGVYVSNSGGFTMSGGEISGNTASSGGGVYVYTGTFIKPSDGVIYGSNVGDPWKNTAGSGDVYGHAAYSSGKKRNTTAGPGVTLDSSKSGAAGGWE